MVNTVSKVKKERKDRTANPLGLVIQKAREMVAKGGEFDRVVAKKFLEAHSAYETALAERGAVAQNIKVKITAAERAEWAKIHPLDKD